MTRSIPSAHRRLVVASLLVALLLVLGAGFLGTAASAAPKDDIVAVDDQDLAVDPTETPRSEPELTPVAIPSVSPEPTKDPFDITAVDDLEVLDVSEPAGTGDLIFSSESCDPIFPGKIDDKWCSPAAPDGYTAYVWLHPSENAYEAYYTGALPVDLLDVPAGRYLVAGGPIPLSKQITLVCRVEDAAGALIEILSGPGNSGLNLQIGGDRVFRCTMYSLPEGELPDEMAPDLPTDGPVELIITDYLCPAGTDPALNYFGLIGRCPQSTGNPRYEARGSGGAYLLGAQVYAGTVSFPLTGGAWTISNDYPTGDHPPIFFCNVRDELYQEPPQYAPFMTYTYGQDGAVMTLEQGMTWLCAAYHIPAATGTGADVAQVTSTIHACPEGTTTPTVASCTATLPGVTVHLLYGTQTIVATKQTDTTGKVTFAAPENLGSFGLAEAIPAGYTQAPSALCSMNGAAPVQYAVDASGILDLGTLVGGDAVSCDWFNIADPTATPPAALDLEVATDLDDLELAPVDETGSAPQNDSGQDEPQDDSGQDDDGEVATPAETSEAGDILPLEEDE